MSKYKQELLPQQSYLLPESLDEAVSKDSPARLVSIFVESLPDSYLQPALDRGTSAQDDQPAYNPRMLLSCWLYAYTLSIASSRELASQVELNIELKWLCDNLRPCHKTLCNFRMENAPLFESALMQFSQKCVRYSVLGAEGALLEVDGKKLHNIISRKTLNRLLREESRDEKEVGAYIRKVKRNDDIYNSGAQSGQRLSDGGDVESFRALLKSQATTEERTAPTAKRT